jgi:CRP/FNR family transcriptional regulator, cyclic AMP receptor protein
MEEGALAVLKTISLFKDLTEEEREIISDKMEMRTIPYHSLVFEEGDPGKEFFIIMSGNVQVVKKDEKKQDHEITRLKTGSCFGDMSLLDRQPRSATIFALEETKLIVFSQESLFELKEENLELYSHIILNLAKEFSARIRSMDEKYIKMLGFFF